MKLYSKILLVSVGLFGLVWGGLAQTTAFTYQGRLNIGGNSANGSYDLTFALFTTNAAGGPVAGPITNSATLVTNGLFTTAIDFGTGVFTGTNYVLEIGVRTNGSASAFSILTPRQSLTAVPYALYAMTPAGPQGPQGIPGPAGATGAVGAQGATGATGSQGPQGVAGPVGPAGSIGAQGPPGTNGWSFNGNNVSTGQFLGSTNNQPVEIRVNGIRAYRFEPSASVPNLIGGFFGNAVDNGAQGATIGGGGTIGFINHISSTLGTVSGGSGHTISANANDATIGGGRQNEIDSGSWGAIIGGGYLNLVEANSSYSSIAGGQQNNIQPYAPCSTIGGGFLNSITGDSNYWVQASLYNAYIGAGIGNSILDGGVCSFIGSGIDNINAGSASVIVGGANNMVVTNGSYSCIGGGYSNTNAGYGSTIIGGFNNNIPIGSYVFIGAVN